MGKQRLTYLLIEPTISLTVLSLLLLSRIGITCVNRDSIDNKCDRFLQTIASNTDHH